MQRVIHLIEALQGAGIPVPPFPCVEPVPVNPGARPALAESEIQARTDAYEARVEAWRQDVITLHRLHFPLR
ncbi:hypothetical protein GNX71_28955 [Variovorax sp. RKNM96]|uniref:hypothetical protein n=1 Tax=Variovorax sp. RKNM96 TaxID=2681552 RepID=UPI0019817D4E|nr:hypothetical protein [Variovorax sp. RKNM96]QSI33380.1 hypothetical protein GNX71_28955 [Variovorax sp. RKNM96]